MIAVDWGTSSFRAYRLDARGGIAEKKSTALGTLAVKDGRFTEALQSQIDEWLAAGETQVVMSGMIGSRQGWLEVPYATCPAGASEIAAGMRRVDWADGQAWIAPGLVCRDGTGVADVMRGEEVQILGALDDLPQSSCWICLPGTHSKWVQVESGRILGFSTHMTGELFAVLKDHSILGRMMREGAPDTGAFVDGVKRARQDGGLLHQLFGVRTRGLFAELSEERSASYLSGLLIGHELASVPELGETVYLLGTPQLTELYTQALRCFGVTAKILDADAVVRGLLRISRHLPA